MADTAEISVALAAKQLAQAVDGLIEPELFYDDNNTLRRVPSLLRRLRGAINSKRDRGRSVPTSRPPCNLHVTEITQRLERFVKDCGRGGGVEYGLRAIAEAAYAPDDVPVILGYTRELLALTAECLDALGESDRPIPLRRRCPAIGCGELFRYSPTGDRKWALVADGGGEDPRVRCLVCHAEWDQSRWGVLAAMLEGAQ